MAKQRITNLQINNPYKFDAYRAAAYTLANAVTTKMPYDAEVFDTGGNYDAATNFRFTAPVAGFYQFNANIYIATATSRLSVQFWKNGAEYTGRQDSNASMISAASSAFVQLAATDYIEVFYFVGGGPGNTANLSHFSGFLVSVT